ncbi:Calpain-D [Orchesella cincta]|uniref:Calpain-D n=1 Tax=Orchesella cincta TaxID=48709 RepID=A0A1D2MY43_ORCCI|nr:Calpain-D [Orchesella cincta]
MFRSTKISRADNILGQSTSDQINSTNRNGPALKVISEITTHTTNGFISKNSAYGESKENLNHFEQKYEKILQTCIQRGTKYIDEDFPASLQSIFRFKEAAAYKGSNEFTIGAKSVSSWQRPENIRGIKGESGSHEACKLNATNDYYGLLGALGNCWFVAALALLCERKELLAKILATGQINAAGVYIVRLFKDGNWTNVIVDDLLPCDSFYRLVFSRCRRKQLWVPLIEKAMAKLHGSYESLQSGNMGDGLNYLTGFQSECIILKSEIDHELLWGRFLSFHSSGFLMGTSIGTTIEKSDIYTANGLVANHVYSVLKIVCCDGIRLIQLHNPWGRFSWNGDWSDASALWTSKMRSSLAPNQSHKGIFWMSYRDYLKYFTSLEVCKVRQGWNAYSLDGILPPYADPDCQPCFELICTDATCQIDISLYQTSKRNSKESLTPTDIGFVILELDGSSKVTRFKRPIEMAKSSRRRCVASSLMIAKGKYYIIPLSFSQWAKRETEEVYYPFTLAVHSSRKLSLNPVRTDNMPHILADAIICCVKKYGKRKLYSVEPAENDISMYSINLGVGYCTVIENGKTCPVRIKMNSSKTLDHTSTRGSFLTDDTVPPRHVQVLQILSANDATKSCQILISKEISVNELVTNLQGHIPKLGSRVAGLHTPRPFAAHYY